MLKNKRMTIREKINRKLRWIPWLSLLGFAVFFFGAVYNHGTNIPVISIIGMAIFLFASLYLNLALRCPCCGKRIGPFIAASGKWWGLHKKVNFCPYCGVNFDTESTK
jgi:DNA-directed RNA polymerase subunit RPC12/RpoP